MNNIDWIGFAGVFLILLAYLLTIVDKISSKSLGFILLNLIGASLACLASVLMKYLPFIILEGVWAIASLFSLYQFMNKKRIQTEKL